MVVVVDVDDVPHAPARSMRVRSSITFVRRCGRRVGDAIAHVLVVEAAAFAGLAGTGTFSADQLARVSFKQTAGARTS
jgi:hypothetical protein